MIRGGLVALSHSLFSGSAARERDTQHFTNVIIKTGAVLELLQSGLLVHDDIMDRDKKRRGDDTLFFQYVTYAKKHHLKDSYHTGEALGICAGDLLFFLAFHLLNELQSGHFYNPEIALLCSREMCRVATAQMSDIYLGTNSQVPPVQDVLELYLNKTGRYTFSLPLKMGALLAGAGQKECEVLEKLGEHLGVIFQIKDDEINLYGSEEVTGKSVGSDIKEGKKTLYISLLFETTKRDEKDHLLSLVGNPGLSLKDFHYIKQLIDEHGIKSRIENIVKDVNEKVIVIIKSMNPPNKDAFVLLKELINYNIKRNK